VQWAGKSLCLLDPSSGGGVVREQCVCVWVGSVDERPLSFGTEGSECSGLQKRVFTCAGSGGKEAVGRGLGKAFQGEDDGGGGGGEHRGSGCGGVFMLPSGGWMDEKGRRLEGAGRETHGLCSVYMKASVRRYGWSATAGLRKIAPMTGIVRHTAAATSLQ
jgi:hypothetical protein